MKLSNKILISVAGIIVIIAFVFFINQPKQSIYTYPLPHACKAIILEKVHDNKAHISLKFKNAGVLRNSINQHGISVLLAKLLFTKVGTLTQEETEEKMQQLGIFNLTVSGTTNNLIISFQVVIDKFIPAIDFIILGLNANFSEEDLSNARSFYPVPIVPETSSPNAILLDKVYQNLYPNHMYGRNSTGTSASISQITLDDIREFFQNNLTLDNLTIYYTGQSPKRNVNILFTAISHILKKHSTPKYLDESHDLDKIAVTEHESQILNKNVKDICCIMTGIRLDHLSITDKASLLIIAHTLFNSTNGEFIESVIPLRLSYNIIDRDDSTILFLTAFMNKKYINLYRTKLHGLSQKSLNTSNLDLSREYLIKNQKQERVLTQSHSFLIFLPFSKCTNEQCQTLLKKIQESDYKTTVILSSEPVQAISSTDSIQNFIVRE